MYKTDVVLSSGEFSGVGVQIEDLTGKVWDNCFHPLLNKVRECSAANH